MQTRFNFSAALHKIGPASEDHSRAFKWGASQLRLSPPSCSGCIVIEVAVAYDSSFCSFFGGTPGEAASDVQLIIAQTSVRESASRSC